MAASAACQLICAVEFRLLTFKRKIQEFSSQEIKALPKKSTALFISIQTIGGLLIQPQIVLFRHHIEEP